MAKNREINNVKVGICPLHGKEDCTCVWGDEGHIVGNKVENKVRPQNKHLKPCKPGETHNPNGRPLGQKNYATLYREALIKLAKLNDKEPEELELELISKGIMNARSGDYRFYKDVLDRLLGTATNKTDITSDGQKIVLMPSELLEKHNDTTQSTS